MKVILLSYPSRPVCVDEMNKQYDLIQSRAKAVQADDPTGNPVEVVLADSTGEADLSIIHADVVIVFGGDGSFLRAVAQMGENQLPLICVNLGKLGFLAGIQPEELLPLLDNMAENANTIRLMMFQATVLRDGRIIDVYHGVNEAAILRGIPYTIQKIEVFIDKDFVTTYHCDGLIISTPVGSTAHCLSAGGPILQNQLKGFIVLPIAAHTLTMRPIVASSKSVYQIKVLEPLESTSLVIDGQIVHHILASDVVEIKKSKRSIRLITPKNRSYYQNLREKLDWGGGFIE